MKLTYYGHSCFLIETAGYSLLFDPMISANELAASIDITGIKPDFILLSHGHFDHLHDAEAIASQSGATIIANYEVAEWYKAKDIKVHHMNIGGKWSFAFGTVKMVTAVHSSVLPDGTYGGAPSGFVVTTADGSFYFAGDTALTMDMQLIPMTCPELSFAILPVGDDLTMGVSDAIIASEMIKCKEIVACHFDTFGYIKLDHESCRSQFSSAGLNIQIPTIGQSIIF
jgi:L-ascorbate metabolism protein UlaG (beta-lactamase superfamily)